MPRKPKQSSPNLDTPEKNVKQGKYWLTNDAPWGGFINVSVTDAEKEQFEDWLVENAADVSRLLDDLLGEGVKYGVAYDRENECYIVTFTGAFVAGSNVRVCVTSRAGTWREADALAVWKHYVLCDGDYGDLYATGRKRSWG